MDAQGTFGLSCQSGLGKARHIETAGLWILDFLERGECELRMVGEEEPRRHAYEPCIPMRDASPS